jgi:hypothetical protein|tara:strand:+ start:15812 stop:15961 length:150 start_codon:yes stop_codon:yes gene_type:complete
MKQFKREQTQVEKMNKRNKAKNIVTTFTFIAIVFALVVLIVIDFVKVNG